VVHDLRRVIEEIGPASLTSAATSRVNGSLPRRIVRRKKKNGSGRWVGEISSVSVAPAPAHDGGTREE
jgi:hypothetical protein